MFSACFYLPDGNIENVTPDGRGDGHVTEALSRDDDGRDEIRNGGSGRKERQPHHLRRYHHSVADHIRPPHHQVRVRGDPQDASHKRNREEFLT